MIAWLMAQRWARTAAVVAVAVAAAVLFILGQRKAGERVGAMKVKLQNSKHAEKVREKMDAVPRGDKPDVADKLRDGTF